MLTRIRKTIPGIQKDHGMLYSPGRDNMSDSMPGFTVAVMGSIDPRRAGELGVRALDDAGKAAIDIGRELAKAQMRIMVYSSDPAFVEPSVVRGYIQSGVSAPNSVEVRYPFESQQPSFPEQTDHSGVFDFRISTSRDWEVAFYQSLLDADAVVAIGGGNSTLIAGVIAIALGRPIVALSGFGGAAAKLWTTIPEERLTREERSFMADQNWTAGSAERVVRCLHDQRERILRAAEDQSRRSGRVRSAANWRAITAAALFVACLAVWPAAWIFAGSDRNWMLIPLLAGPLIAGASGATVRQILDPLQPGATADPTTGVSAALLGMVAGGMTAVIFLLSELFALPDAADPKVVADHAKRLVPFAIVIGFLAGLTLDTVFRKLRSEQTLADISGKFQRGGVTPAG